MDIELARRDVLDWIQDFVEAPNSALEGWPPCPFARAARLANMIDIRAGTAPESDLQALHATEPFEVIVLVYDASTIDAAEFDLCVDRINGDTLAARDLIALADHPRDAETVRGVVMNQGNWALVLVQRLSRLDSAAQQLAQQGYYTGWPEDYLRTLFRHRRDPRA